MTKNVVSIIPRFGPTGQLRMLETKGELQLNSIVDSLINLVEFTEGRNSIFPTMGVFTTISSIAYSNSLETLLNDISDRVSTFMEWEITFATERKPEYPEILEVNMYIDNLPGRLVFDITQDKSLTTLLNPRWIKQ
jgi:hypothetical protein